jgi:hypothetical protein
LLISGDKIPFAMGAIVGQIPPTLNIFHLWDIRFGDLRTCEYALPLATFRARRRTVRRAAGRGGCKPADRRNRTAGGATELGHGDIGFGLVLAPDADGGVADAPLRRE